MKLIQIKNIVKGETCLVANCHGHGRFIGKLDNDLYEKYKGCSICQIGHGYYREFGNEIWIQVSPKLQKNLCKDCGWDNCWENPKHLYNIKKGN